MIRSIISTVVRSIIRPVVGVGQSLPQWTLQYNGSSTYGELDSAFSPTGANSTLNHVMFHESGTAQQLLGPDASAFDLSVSSIGVLTFNLIANVEIDGSPATSGVTVLSGGYHTITGDFDVTADVKYIGALAGTSLFYKRQVHLTDLNDPDTPANSIKINNIISAAIQPTDFNIRNALQPALGSDSTSITFADKPDANDLSVGMDLIALVDNHSYLVEFEYNNNASTPGVILGGDDSNLFRLQSGVTNEKFTGSFVGASIATNNLTIEGAGSICDIFNVSVKETNIIGTYNSGVYELVEGV